MTNIEKEYYKVLDSTVPYEEEKEKMVGGVYECYAKYYCEDRIILYNEDKNNAWAFNHSDVQKVFDPDLKFNGEVIGKGDEVACEMYGPFIISLAHKFRGEWIITGHVKDSTNNTYSALLSEITSHTPLFKKEKYIELNGKKYRKEVEEVLREYEVK